MTICTGFKRNGSPCTAPATWDSDLCGAHKRHLAPAHEQPRDEQSFDERAQLGAEIAELQAARAKAEREHELTLGKLSQVSVKLIAAQQRRRRLEGAGAPAMMGEIRP